MKKYLSLLLSLVMVLALAACGGTSSTTSDPESSDPGGTAAASDENYYSGKTIQWIIPWAAGGSTDITSRALAQRLEQKLGCTIVILNTDGGGGLVGFNTISGAENDGSTIGSATSSMLLFKASGKADIDYDIVDWLCMYVYVPAAIVVPKDSPFETLEDLVAYGKEHPEEATYSTSGFGNYCHAAIGVLESLSGASFSQVSYDSGAEAATAAAGGHVSFAACAVSEAAAMVDSGDLRMLCVIGEERSSAYPDVPTTAEAGFPGMESTYTAVVMPKDCPEEAVTAMSTALEEIITSDEWKEYIVGLGNIAQYMGGDAFDTYLAEQAKAFENIQF